MLAKMLNAEPSMFVFFYEEGDIFSRKVLRDLEKLDDRLDSLNIEIVKICDDGIDDDYELESLPSLVHFKKGQPSVYYGDLKQDDEIAEWIDAQSQTSKTKKWSLLYHFNVKYKFPLINFACHDW